MALNEFGQDNNAYIPVATPIDGPVDHPVDGPIEYQVEYQAPSNPMLLEAMSRPRAAGHLGILIVASIVLQFVVVFAVMVASGESFDPEKQDTSLSLLVATVAIGLVLVLRGLRALGRVRNGQAAHHHHDHHDHHDHGHAQGAGHD